MLNIGVNSLFCPILFLVLVVGRKARAAEELMAENLIPNVNTLRAWCVCFVAADNTELTAHLAS